jgi:mono/diheme cytochrome c family protein
MKSLVLTIALLSFGALAAEAEVIATAPTEAVARGEYLAVSVAQCIQCHSPHDREGNLLRDQLFTGQAMPLTSPYPDGPRWAPRAPAIKRLPGWSVEEFVSILTTGKRLNGRRPASPMPQFRMSTQDAEAIAAYLKSM